MSLSQENRYPCIKLSLNWKEWNSLIFVGNSTLGQVKCGGLGYRIHCYHKLQYHLYFLSELALNKNNWLYCIHQTNYYFIVQASLSWTNIAAILSHKRRVEGLHRSDSAFVRFQCHLVDCTKSTTERVTVSCLPLGFRWGITESAWVLGLDWLLVNDLWYAYNISISRLQVLWLSELTSQTICGPCLQTIVGFCTVYWFDL